MAKVKAKVKVKTKLRQGDNVVVIAGKDKGKTGKILSILKEDSKVLIEGINIVKKTKKSENPENKQAQIITKTMPIHISNVMYYSPTSKKGERLTYKFIDDKKKIRTTVRSKEELS